MSKKQIESTVSKYLRKANRYKSTQLKLEKINELIEILRTTSTYASDEKGLSAGHDKTEEKRDKTLEMYIELCYIHKIKFQMDALFVGVKRDIEMFKHDSDQTNQDVFVNLTQRLRAVLEINANHPEAPTLLNALIDEYPQYAATQDSSDTYLNIAPYQQSTLRIEITCKLADIKKNPTLQSIYTSYQVTSPKPGHTEQESAPDVCQLRFSLDQLSTFETFHEVLRAKSTYRIMVNNQVLDEKFFSAWFQCYKRFLKANNPQYCYGGSPFTFNFLGCHKLYMKDVAKQLGKCWFHYGALDQNSGVFLVAADQIIHQIQPHLLHCGFCPALTQQKLVLGIALIPKYINPECDSRWNYFSTNGKRTGVVPTGNDIAISTQDNEFGHTESAPSTPSATLGTGPLGTGALIEVGATPYLEKALRYLQSRDISELSEMTYRDLSHCMNCGAVYKPHTMTCSKCKTSFWKYALKTLESVLAKQRYTKAIDLSSVQQRASDSETGSSPLESDLQQQAVSFTQLWNDPEVQEILIKKQETRDEKHSAEKSDQAATYKDNFSPAPETSSSALQSSAPKTLSSGRFDLHEKLRSLISKKYRERKAIEQAFSQNNAASPSPGIKIRRNERSSFFSEREQESKTGRQPEQENQFPSSGAMHRSARLKDEELFNAVRKLKPRQKSELSKRGVVRVIYHATMDKETCPLCNYLDGMVMDPDDPATDIFSPPLYPGCTCRREYVLKTEKPSNWPKVTFQFPPKELLIYLEK